MKKLHGIVCDGCRKFIPYHTNTYITIQGKKRKLHYCCETCRDRYHSKGTYYP